MEEDLERFLVNRGIEKHVIDTMAAEKVCNVGPTAFIFYS